VDAHGAGAEPAAVEVAELAELADLLNRAAFAPGTLTAQQANRAATIAQAYVAGLRATRPWWRRLLWSVHPGPLRRDRADRRRRDARV